MRATRPAAPAQPSAPDDKTPVVEPRTGSGAVWVTWIALLGVNALGILPWALVKFPNVDLAEMVYQVRRLELGYVPYRDTFTHHFVGYVVPFYLLDQILPLTPPVLKLAAVSLNFITAVLVYCVLREITRGAVSWMGAFLAVSVGWFWGWQGFGFNVQSYLAPLLTLLLYLMVRSCTRERPSDFCVGALVCGALVTFDQRMIPFVVLLVLPPYFVPTLRRFTTLSVSFAAFAAVPACCGWYLWRTGAWHDFVAQTFIFPLYYRNHGIDAGEPFALAWFRFLLLTEPSSVVVTLITLGWMWTAEKRTWVKFLLTGAFLCAAAYSAAGGRLYENYFLVLGPVVLILMGIARWYAAMSSATAGVVAGVALVSLGVLSALKPLNLYRQTGSLFVRSTEGTVVNAADYVRNNTQPEDGVLVWGFAPQIYVLSDRYKTFKDAGLLSIAGGNFLSTSAGGQARVPQMVRQFEDYLDRTPPKLIVSYALLRDVGGVCYGKGVMQPNLDFTRADYLKPLYQLITTKYYAAFVTEDECDRAEIFVRKEPTQREVSLPGAISSR